MNLKLPSFQYTPAETPLKAVEFSWGEKRNIGVTQQKIRPRRCVFTSKHLRKHTEGKNSLTLAPVFSSLLFFVYIPFTLIRSLS